MVSASPRVLLLNPPARRPVLRDYYCSSRPKGAYLWEPLDLVVQSGFLRRRCRLRAIDAVAERQGPRRVLAAVRDYGPDVVLCMVGSAAWDEDRAFLRALAATTPARIVCSGDLARFQVEALAAAVPRLDAVLMDFHGPALADWIAAGLPVAGPGPVRLGAAVIRDKARFRLPPPALHLFPWRRYRLPFGPCGPVLSVLTSYGCPYGCAFCNSAAPGYQRRAIPDAMAQVAQLRRLGIAALFVRDMSFGADANHAHAFCSAMADEYGRALPWNAYLRVDEATPDLLEAMARAGCYLVQLGIETGDDGLLERHGKGATTAQARQAVARARALGLEVAAHFVLGLPGETAASLARTEALLHDLEPDYAAINTATPRHGSALGAAAGASLAMDPSADGRRLAARFYLRPARIRHELVRLRDPREALRALASLRVLLRT